MGNGVKILLVALLILSVVVVAKFVQEDSSVESAESTPGQPVAKDEAGKRDATRRPEREPPTGPASTAARRAGSGRIVGTTTSQRSLAGLAPSSGRVRQSSSSPGRITPRRASPGSSTAPGSPTTPASGELTLPMKTRPSKATPPAGSSSPGAAAPAAGQTLLAQRAPTRPGDGRTAVKSTRNRNGDIGSPGFDPVPSPGAGDDSGPLVHLDPGTRTSATAAANGGKPDAAPFRTTHSELRDFSRAAKKATDGDAAGPRVVDSRTGTARSSPFNQPVHSASAAPRPGPSTADSSADFPKTHTVVKGDTYWDLAERYYGSGLQNRSIQEANGSKPLVPGMKVKIPAPPRSAVKSSSPVSAKPPASGTGTIASASSAKTGRSVPPNAVKSKDGRYYIHTVRSGETLSDLARRYYGSPRSFDRILDANRSLHYESLRVNQKIKIPVR